MSYARFAIYYVAPEGPLASFGARWLGWDVARGSEVDRFDVPDLDDRTVTPGKYGFHGTLKPPFRLAEGHGQAALEEAAARLAAGLAPARCDGLALARLGRFLALVPQGDSGGIGRVAQACVETLDAFRAPATEAELARRRKAGLTERQEALLLRWGYPYVAEAFRFHLTLTGKLPKAEIAQWMQTAEAHLPALPAPFVLDEIALCGERPDGRFEVIHRYGLAG